ncbi:MAG TPA: RHS repeat-associated core domain-containing protein [Pseudoxanthomonas sp.]
MRLCMQLLCAGLAMGSLSAGAQDVEPWREYGKTISAAREVSAIDDGAFGASTSLYSGATEFTNVDVSIPGNNPLPVQFARRYSVSDRQGAGLVGGLGDWDIDVPYIGGSFSAAFGWVTNTSTSPSRFLRCSTAVAPPSGSAQFSSEEVWSGYELHIPGSSNQELTKTISGAYPMPSTGSYPWTTSTTGRLSCVAPLQNGGQGEGFEYVDADGIKYRFDWPIERSIRGLKKPPLGNVSRKQVYLLATQISDRFGNTVTLTYTGDKLTSVTASDGRQIAVTYSSGKVQTVSANGRTWNYAYQPNGNLSQVTNPDGSTWTYTSTGVLATAYTEELLSSMGSAFCPEPGLGQGHFEYTIKHPAGASNKYVFDLLRHYRAGVPWLCQREVPPNTIYHFQAGGTLNADELRQIAWIMAGNEEGNELISFATALTMIGKSQEQYLFEGMIEAEIYDTPAYDKLINTNFFDVFSLSTSLLTGPGIASALTTYNYGTVTTDGFCHPGQACIDNTGNSPDPDSKWVTVTKPNGDKSLSRFGVIYGKNEGQQLAVQIENTTAALRRDNFMYVTDAEAGTLGFGANFGQPLRSDSMLGKVRPLKQTTVSQDGATFNSHSLTFDAFARPLVVDRWSGGMAANFGRTDATQYHDNLTKWVVGQVATVTCLAPTSALPTGCGASGAAISETTYDSTYALPLTTKSFGKLQQTLTYDTTSTIASGQLGTLKTVADGNNNVTTLSNWKRGIPQSIQYPATSESPTGATQLATVNDNGWITSVADENEFTTSYGYDAMGRIASIVYPTGDSTAWNTTTQNFIQINSDEHGLAPGHWRSSRATGNGYLNVYYDAMWRPVLEEKLDLGNVSGTLSQVVKRYDASGRLAFQSYPVNNVTDFQSVTQGARTFYDALDRVTRTEQDSELGVLASTTEYLTGFQTRVTNPRTLQTTITYKAYDTPSFDLPVTIQEPESKSTTIARDVFGKPTSIARSGGGVSVTRSYVYDGYQQLCKTIEPETGATIVGYDAAGNLSWSAAGLSYPSTATCEQAAAYASGRAVLRTYDARNRLTQLLFPDGRGNQSWSYTPDGLPTQITTGNETGGGGQVINAYSYNKRRMLTSESVQQPGWYTWDIDYGYGYDGNGSLSSQTYPTGLVVNYAPNALGQPTQAGSYATGVQYYPNGSIKQFTYGNGLTHNMSQNARQLPSQSIDTGNALNHQYTYDANANVTAIFDNVTGTPTAQHRYMTYDGLDRLTGAGSAMFGGSDHWHFFTYDALDNLKSWKQAGLKDYANYVYDPTSNQLTNIKNTAGATVVGLSYDVQGNLANKNGQLYDFTYGNRLRTVPNKEAYLYDGHGRRVQATKIDGSKTLWQYSQSGQMLFSWNGPTSEKTHENIYLGGSLVATVDHDWPSNTVIATKYQHTDALGSPVAVTDAAGAVIDRTNYEPYGAAINKPNYNGIGYTGHVMDGATGLTYMQQRYYDPICGCFLSVDPVTAYEKPLTNFNRYAYANNNPYRFTDPDGRQSATMPLVTPQGAENFAGYVFSLIVCGGCDMNYVAPAGSGEVTPVGFPGEVLLPSGAVRGMSSKTATVAAEKMAPSIAARVGRWMSSGEHAAMAKTGKVQESLSGTTHVASPADAATFGRQAPSGSVYVEFDVPAASVKSTGPGVAKIVGPNSLEGRLAAKKGQPAPEMPACTNIKVCGSK